MRADAPSFPRPPSAGDILDGRYRIIKPLARGGTSTVFLAEHTLIKRPLAIKILSAQLTRERSIVERFMSEALVTGTLGHPNIIQATDMGFANERPYIVFEYLEGCLLAEEIHRVGELPLRRALDIALQIASALDAAHAAEIVHLDLNTNNIMLTHGADSFDHVKLLDFGIARLVSAVTDDDPPFGTPEFIAPEQVYAPGWIDPRTDVYALGVCLYEMLARRRPFRSDSPRAVFHQILHEEPSPIERELPPELRAAIFERMLAKEPRQRFATMADAINALDTIARALPETQAVALREPRRPRPATAVEPLPARATSVTTTTQRLKRPSTVAALLGRPLYVVLLAAIVAGAAGYLYARKSRPTARDDARVATSIPASTPSRVRALALENAKQRALAIAASPMLRAAIETDAPTMLDLLTTEEPFALRPGEVLEVYQGTSLMLARVPPGSAPLLPHETSDDAPSARVQVSVPVLGRDRTRAGTLVLSVPNDDVTNHR
jgi:tRNA A-37 threonylcarbamoyl transferase component Bud32